MWNISNFCANNSTRNKIREIHSGNIVYNYTQIDIEEFAKPLSLVIIGWSNYFFKFVKMKLGY